MKIEITNDEQKMIAIAKEIVKEKNKIYTERTFERIEETVRNQLKTDDKKLIEDTVYKTIYYYWAYGCNALEYFYYGFYDKTYEQIKEYVTIKEKVNYIDRISKVEDAHLLNNKWDTYNLFKEYYLRDVIRIENENDYPEFCKFVEKHKEFVVKPVDMGCGQGVHKVTVKKDASDEEKKKLFNDILSESDVNQKMFQRGADKAIVLEEIIVQDPRTEKIHPQSVNGVRITTVRVGDKVTVLYPWFKIGRGGNFLVSGVCGTLVAGIDVETGKVNSAGYSENCEVFDVHPDTGIPFVGYQIPRWDELIATVKELAMKLDTINYVGWDMVLTEKGWCIMEGNFRGSFLWQLIIGRGTKQEFENLIGYKETREFWWE